MSHNFQNHSTKYGPVYYCKFCKVTPNELKSMTQEERDDLEENCRQYQIPKSQ